MTHKVSVVGQGFVGGSITTVLSERGFETLVFDIAGKVAKGGTASGANSLVEHVKICDKLGINTHFLCLPTPMTELGSADTSIVLSAIADIASIPIPETRERTVIVKSTVPPGSCASWDNHYSFQGTRVVFSPEFLTEARCLDDMREQDRIILGGHPVPVAQVAMIMSSAFPGVPVIRMTASEAEMVKYLANCYLATKVSFSNEMRQICESLTKMGISCDFNNVIQAATLDKRLGESHWKTPGPDGLAGFGGSCFPKDINALIVIARIAGVDPIVLEAVWNKNLEVRPEKDWEKLKGRAVV